MTNCAHHWDIEPGTGPTSTGICRNCGLVKAFANHIVVDNVFSKQPKPSSMMKRAQAQNRADLQAAIDLTRDYTRDR